MSKLQVTGYRGIWGESLNEQVAFEYARAFARMLNSLSASPVPKKVIIGRDTRLSGSVILASVRQALTKEGIEAVIAGILPTPSVLLLVKKLRLDGGVMITASHNPPEYNGIKFVVPGGRLTNKREVEIMEKFRNAFSREEKTPGPIKTTEEKTDNRELRKLHIDEILKNVDVSLIRSKKYKVTLDAINGAGAIIGPELLRELGCKVNLINGEQTGVFAHVPEPLVQNLGQLREATAKNESDIGFAQDPDADRLAFVNEKGEYVSEEYTCTLGIKNILAKTPGSIVVTASSSRVNDDIAAFYGQKIFKTSQGEANVIAKIFETGSIIGGEGGGGAIYPKINTSRDSLVGMALILDLMARENKKISQIIAELPEYYMKKDKIPVVENPNTIYEKLKKEFASAKLTEMDGVRFDWPDFSWFGVRASNTEPIIRITAEAKTQERLNSLFDQVRLTLGFK